MEADILAKAKHETNKMISNVIRQMLNALKLFPDGIATLDDLDRTIEYVQEREVCEYTKTSADGTQKSILYTSYIFDLMFDFMCLLHTKKLDAKMIIDNSQEFYKNYYRDFFAKACDKINQTKNLNVIKNIEKN